LEKTGFFPRKRRKIGIKRKDYGPGIILPLITLLQIPPKGGFKEWEI